MAAYKIVLLRHGESVWNRKNLFTGWADVALTRKGVEEAKKAGETLKKKGYVFDIVFTNLHIRSLKTVRVVLDAMGIRRIPVSKTWRLNERHYGALIGLNKAETAHKYGEKQVLLWRRSYRVRPPALKKSDKMYKAIVNTYGDVPKKYIPVGESLADTYRRTVPYWKDIIVPAIKEGKHVLIVASHNSLRSLLKYLDNIPDKAIPKFTIPTGIPLVYELNESMKPKRHYYLGDPNAIKKSLAGIAAQGKAPHVRHRNL